MLPAATATRRLPVRAEATVDTGARLVANDVMVYARRLGTIDIKPEGRIVIQP